MLAQCAADLVAEDNAAQRRGDDQIASAVPAPLRQLPTELLSDVRVLDQVRALQKQICVPTALHQEMSFLQRPRLTHQRQRFFLRHFASLLRVFLVFMIPTVTATVN